MAGGGANSAERDTRRLARKPGRDSAGFTLIELMVVITVIGILAAIAIPNYSQAHARARRASCVSNQRHLLTAAALYVCEQGIQDDVLNCSDLHTAHYIPAGLTECPESDAEDNDDYELTVESGTITAITCLINPDEHAWTP